MEESAHLYSGCNKADLTVLNTKKGGLAPLIFELAVISALFSTLAIPANLNPYEQLH
jgi:hypothetical protein